jgi:hypothetical protein
MLNTIGNAAARRAVFEVRRRRISPVWVLFSRFSRAVPGNADAPRPDLVAALPKSRLGR